MWSLFLGILGGVIGAVGGTLLTAIVVGLTLDKAFKR